MEEKKEFDAARVLEMTTKAGEILLQNGAEIFRVEETMLRMSSYFGVETKEFFVLSNGIFTTGSREQQYAKVLYVPVRGVRFDKIIAVNQLSREIETGKYTLEEVEDKLKEIEQMPGKRELVNMLGSGIGSGAFCALFGGSLMDSLGAGIAGFVLYLFILRISDKYLSKITGNISGAALVTLICILCYKVGIGDNLNHMVSGAAIPLFPGVPFINAIREIADSDYLAGTVRMMDAILRFICIGIGVGVVFAICHRIAGGI